MANIFNSIRIRPPKRNRFNLSHDVKLTAKFGKLIPILCQDCLPGDVYKMNSEILVRMAPMLAPIMTKVNVYTHFFFVPKRLVWSHWKEFITGGETGEESPLYPRLQLLTSTVSSHTPNADFNSFHPGSLADYLNFPVAPAKKSDGSWLWIYPGTSVELDALPFRAYQLIYNEYYRDQNVDPEVDIRKDVDGLMQVSGNPYTGDKSVNYELMKLRDRSWQKDYFTSALPFAQRGDEVTLPLQGEAEIVYGNGKVRTSGEPIDTVISSLDEKSGANLQLRGVNSQPISSNLLDLKLSGTSSVYAGSLINPNDTGAVVTSDPHIHTLVNTDDLKKFISGVDLSSASSTTINELRRAIKAQEFLELSARAGSRYIEQIYAYFGVKSSDARLQRPEFLGGGKSPIMISDVLQTSQSTETSAQANPSGHGVSVQNSHSFKYACEEHGYIIGIMSVMPKAAYMQGLPRQYSKFDRLDYYWPQFAHLGEQEILNKELYYPYWQSPEQYAVSPDGTFGYTPRYAEYKTAQDSVHGDFRGSLSFWHMGRIFGNAPQLNSAFLHNVEDAANRVFNVVDEDVDKLWCNIHHNLIALRKMPKYGTPMI